MCRSAPSCRVSHARVITWSPWSANETNDRAHESMRDALRASYPSVGATRAARQVERASWMMQMLAMKTDRLLDNATDAADRCRSCGCAPTRRLFKRRNTCGKCFYLFECLK